MKFLKWIKRLFVKERPTLNLVERVEPRFEAFLSYELEKSKTNGNDDEKNTGQELGGIWRETDDNTLPSTHTGVNKKF